MAMRTIGKKKRNKSSWKNLLFCVTALITISTFYNYYVFIGLQSISLKENNAAVANSGPPAPEPLDSIPPEPLDSISFCAEKCRYVPEMCSQNLHRDRLSLPAPLCRNYSLTVEDDVYWADFSNNNGRGICNERHAKTVELVLWAAARARERRERQQKQQQSATSYLGPHCEDIPTENTSPMMWPEEFEFITKLMANAKPRTYLEWGCGTSTSFYPLLASGQVIAIDGYPPWCQQVAAEPRVKCMVKEEKHLKFYCPELVGADGITKLNLLEVGKIPVSTADEDIEAAMRIYVDTSFMGAVAETNVEVLDVALVDGRFRLQCALKLLPYFGPNSILLLHDFWVRQNAYKIVLEYYYVVGYARSVVALKKKDTASVELERTIYERYMNKEYLTWFDIA